MALFDTIDFTQADTTIVDAFESLAGSSWNGSHRHVKALRSLLLQLQRYRCVYCQAVFQSDEVGSREMEHILPKSGSKDTDPVKAHSGAFEDRWHTDGYPGFTYLATNVAVTCKLCNSRKGSFDSRTHRVTPVAGYPAKTEFSWVHPHHCRYDEHIKLIDMRLYQARTPSGLATIMVCGLDRVEVVEAKFLFRARAQLAQADTVESAIRSAENAIESGQYGRKHALRAVQDRFDLSHAEVERLTALDDAIVGSDTAYPDVTALARLQEILMVSEAYLCRSYGRTSTARPTSGTRTPREPKSIGVKPSA